MMRSVYAALAITSLSACAGPPADSGNAPSPIEKLTAGKVAGAPLKCLPSYAARDQLVIGPDTIAYRDGSSRVSVNHLSEGCSPLDSHVTLVTHSVTSELCSGDFVSVIEPPSSFVTASCTLGDFIPYTAPSK